MSNKKTDNDAVLAFLGGIVCAIIGFPISLLTATYTALSSLECNPPGSDCNGIVKFTSSIGIGLDAFIVTNILWVIAGGCIVWLMLKRTISKK